MRRGAILLCLFAALAAGANAEPSADAADIADEPKPKTENELCALIESAAADHGLPLGFFTRLLWKESRFRADAISPKGAQGIAQFMPGTAAERGVLDPFDPMRAIPASASFLADLKAQFGNLGLAAAAYNAGAQRVSNWLADTSTLPWETEDFVLSITGIAAERWRTPEQSLPEDNANETCLTLVATLKIPGNSIGPAIAPTTAPWGVQIAGNFSRARAMSIYARLQERHPSLLGERLPMVIGTRMRGRGTRPFYRVRAPAQDRREAERLCADLQAAGASCIVLKT